MPPRNEQGNGFPGQLGGQNPGYRGAPLLGQSSANNHGNRRPSELPRMVPGENQRVLEETTHVTTTTVNTYLQEFKGSCDSGAQFVNIETRTDSVTTNSSNERVETGKGDVYVNGVHQGNFRTAHYPAGHDTAPGRLYPNPYAADSTAAGLAAARYAENRAAFMAGMAAKAAAPVATASPAVPSSAVHDEDVEEPPRKHRGPYGRRAPVLVNMKTGNKLKAKQQDDGDE